MYILYAQPLEFERVFNTLSIVLLCVLLVGVMAVSVILLARMKRKMEGMMKTIEIISTELKKKSEIIDKVEVADSGEALQSLLSQIDGIYGSFYRHGDSEVGKRNMMGQVQEVLDYIRGYEFLESLEKSINRDTGNLLKDFYASVGKTQDKRRQLIVFTYYNLSVETVCLVLDITPNALYKRRARLKEVIETSGFSRAAELQRCLFPRNNPET